MKMKKRGRDKGVRKDPLSFHKPSTLELGVHSRWLTNERTSGRTRTAPNLFRKGSLGLYIMVVNTRRSCLNVALLDTA